MNLVHSDKNIIYVDVDNFDGVGSGPGYSLLCCKSELQEPFVFTSVDTLVDDDIDIMFYLIYLYINWYYILHSNCWNT